MKLEFTAPQSPWKGPFSVEQDPSNHDFVITIGDVVARVPYEAWDAFHSVVHAYHGALGRA